MGLFNIQNHICASYADSYGPQNLDVLTGLLQAERRWSRFRSDVLQSDTAAETAYPALYQASLLWRVGNVSLLFRAVHGFRSSETRIKGSSLQTPCCCCVSVVWFFLWGLSGIWKSHTFRVQIAILSQIKLNLLPWKFGRSTVGVPHLGQPSFLDEAHWPGQQTWETSLLAAESYCLSSYDLGTPFLFLFYLPGSHSASSSPTMCRVTPWMLSLPTNQLYLLSLPSAQVSPNRSACICNA